MDKLFDKRDILTIVTADQAVKGDRGYFGRSLCTIAYNVEQDNVHRLCDINENETSCFTDEEGLDYLFFLPVEKVKRKELSYRPIKSIEELFNFLIPDIDVDCSTLEKVKCVLCRLYELRGKHTGYIYYKTFTRICLADDDIKLDECTLKNFFKDFEIKKDGEWVPFGIKE